MSIRINTAAVRAAASVQESFIIFSILNIDLNVIFIQRPETGPFPARPDLPDLSKKPQSAATIHIRPFSAPRPVDIKTQNQQKNEIFSVILSPFASGHGPDLGRAIKILSDIRDAIC